MHCLFLPALLFATAGLAESVGYWTLHNFTLFCEATGTTCAYHFSISQDRGATPGDPCLFIVSGADGKAANQTDFSNMACIGNTQYQVNGGWSDQGFITVVVTDVRANLYAFFAYADEKISDSQTVEEETRIAYKVGTFDITNMVMPTRRSRVEWQVLALNTDYDQSTGNIELQFAVKESNTLSPCTVITKGADKDEDNVGSFHNQKCVESDWFVSWDYSVMADSATLTLVEPSSMMKAWFPWENVSSSSSLGNSLKTMASPGDDEARR